MKWKIFLKRHEIWSEEGSSMPTILDQNTSDDSLWLYLFLYFKKYFICFPVMQHFGLL